MEAKYMTSLTHAREVFEDGRMEGFAEGEVKGRTAGFADGKRQSILGFLGELGDIPEPLREKISAEENPETLENWVKLAARAGSFADFEKNTKEK